MPFAVGEFYRVIYELADPASEIPLQDESPGCNLAQHEPALRSTGLIKKNLMGRFGVRGAGRGRSEGGRKGDVGEREHDGGERARSPEPGTAIYE